MKNFIIAASLFATSVFPLSSVGLATDAALPPVAALTQDQMKQLMGELRRAVQDAEVVPVKISTSFAGCTSEPVEYKKARTDYGLLLPVKDVRAPNTYFYYYCPVKWAAGHEPGPIKQ